MSTSLPDIFEPYDKLVAIEILGVTRLVPENNSLLRCFQFLALENISYGDFCWNGECLNCQVWIMNGEKEKAVIACRTMVLEGMQIVRLAEGIDLTDGDIGGASTLAPSDPPHSTTP